MARPRPNASPGAARGPASAPPSSSPWATISTTISRRWARRRAPRPARAARPLRGRERRAEWGARPFGERRESMDAIVNLRHEPKLREAFEYAHVHNNTVLIDRRTKWGNKFRIGRDGTRDGSSRATAPISGGASARARSRWRNSRNSTAAGSLVIAIRCPVTAMCSNAQRHGPPGSWRSGQVGERQMGLLACRHGIHGDAFGPGYPLQSPVAALPAISASIPIASSRWRSLRATLARKAATSAHRSGGRAKHNRRRGRCLEQTNTPPT